jgi:hypothetical protein
MSMKRYHGHTLLYLHETISLGSGGSDRFLEVFGEVYHPMMEDLGARLFALWETTSYNGHWPQVTIIWELDGTDYSRIGRRRRRAEATEARGCVGFVHVRDWWLGRGPHHVRRGEQQDARPTQGSPTSRRDW